MKVNLKKAATLSSALASTQIKFEHSFAIDVFADPPTAENAKTAQEGLNNHVILSMNLLAASFMIRQLIGQANADKINELLAARAMIEKQLSILNTIPVRPNGTNIEALTRQIKAARLPDARPNPYGRGLILELETESILSPIFRKLRRAKRDIDDELQGLNFNTTIEIPEDVVKILTDLDLV